VTETVKIKIRQLNQAQAEQFAIPIMFFVTRQQQEIIEKAIETA
jgi:hypothetical protein